MRSPLPHQHRVIHDLVQLPKEVLEPRTELHQGDFQVPRGAEVPDRVQGAEETVEDDRSPAAGACQRARRIHRVGHETILPRPPVEAGASHE